MTNTFYESHLKIVFALLLTALVCLIVILSSVPPVSRDALTHHLAVPKLYLEHGGIYEIPSIIFSYYPMNLDLLYIIPLYFKNDIVPKFIHFAFALLTAIFIFSYLRKRLSTVWALFGALFFLSLPIIVKLSITVYVDLGLVFFSTASIIILLKWVESRFQLKFLLLSAVCCGLALGTKYNGLIVLFILSVFIPFVFISKSKNFSNAKKAENKKSSINVQYKALGFGAIFCTAALLVFSPWMIKNYVWKKNPVYPLYNSFFNPAKTAQPETLERNTTHTNQDGRSLTQNKTSARWGPLALRKIVYNESWWETALIPVRIFFQGQDDNPKYFDGRLSPFLFLLPFFAFFRLKKGPPAIRTEKKIFLFFTVLYILYAFFQTDMRIRYIVPIVPPLVILAIFGLHQLTAMVANRWTNAPNWLLASCTVLLIIFMLSLNASYIIKQFKYVDPFSYIRGRADRDAYITRYRPEYTVIQYANRNLADNAKLLALFLGNRSYYTERELISGNNLFRKNVKTAKSSDGIVTKMQKLGITHLLIRYDLFNRWSSVQFNDKEKEMLRTFFKENLTQLFSQSGYGLFRLKQK